MTDEWNDVEFVDIVIRIDIEDLLTPNGVAKAHEIAPGSDCWSTGSRGQILGIRGCAAAARREHNQVSSSIDIENKVASDATAGGQPGGHGRIGSKIYI